jgi:tetratricopeptide (TPR) repeat protein
LTVLNNLATCYDELGRYDDAVRLHEQTFRAIEATRGPSYSQTLVSLRNLAEAYRGAGRIDASITNLQLLLARQMKFVGPSHADTSRTVASLTSISFKNGRFAQAETMLRGMLEAQTNADSLIVAQTQTWLAEALLRQARFSEAAPLLRQAVRGLAPGRSFTLNAQSLLGWALTSQEEFEPAETLLLEAYDGLKQRRSRAYAGSLKDTAERLVHLYEAWKKPEQAAKWRTALVELQTPAP